MKLVQKENRLGDNAETPQRISDTLQSLRARLQTLHNAGFPTSKQAERDAIAAALSLRVSDPDSLYRVLGIIELLWLCWQQDMRRARGSRELTDRVIEEARWALENPVKEGATLYRAIHRSVMLWGDKQRASRLAGRITALARPSGQAR